MNMTSNDDDSSVALETLIGLALRANVPELPETERLAVAQEFLGFAGQLMELLSRSPSVARGAALLYVANCLGLDRSDEPSSRLMLTLIGAMERARDAFTHRENVKTAKESAS